MNSAHMETLLVLIDVGSFEAAAAHLGISTSAVSQRIKAMEKQAGRVLVQRTNPVGLTDAGEVIIQAARRMALLRAEMDAQLGGKIDRVPLAVAVNADSLATWFRPVLWAAARWENVALQLRLEDEAHTLALLRRGDVLGAVTREHAPVSGCEVEVLGSMRYLAVATADLRSAYSTSEGVDWARMPALRFGPNDALQDADLEGRLDPAVRPRRRVSHVPSSEAFVEATCAGLGWSLLPEQQAHPLLASGEVVRLDDHVVEVPLYWQRWRLESPTLDVLSAAVVGAAEQLER
ncbi:LysR family transcriptional regulator ArgP [Corynebacterium lowii]|uniref:LysR family transcriptional regulator ArgP n=1 Tax=Corynebacterium lowii TaxID=1544413 RepID=UPI0006DC2DFE|nr:LysR family transcriptional regulator ArgP [Corynebacterium lowii]MDP9850890.1 LysR family transcriptional regulator (chromosome initiation inhibitor) [Corynebacterium lowii]